VAKGVNATNSQHQGSTALFGSAADSNDDVTFSSRFPGAAGNYTLEFLWKDSENLLKSKSLNSADENEWVFIEATGVPKEAKAAGAGNIPDGEFVDNGSGEFVIDIRAVAQKVKSGANYQYVIKLTSAEFIKDVGGTPTPVDMTGVTSVKFKAPAIEGLASLKMTKVYLAKPSSGALVDGDHATLSFSTEVDISPYAGAKSWGNKKLVLGTILLDDAENGDAFEVSSINDGVATAFKVPLQALMFIIDSVSSVMVKRDFDISVHNGGLDDEVIYSYGDISVSPDADNSLEKAMPVSPEKRSDDLAMPVACEFGAGIDGVKVLTALDELLETDSSSISGPRYYITLDGGSDGELPGSSDYGGESSVENGSTGLAAFEDIEDISIVMVPAATEQDEVQNQAIVSEMQKHCHKMRYRVGIVDARKDMSLSEVRSFRSNFDDSRLALYYPWVVAADPTGARNTITVPPAGFIAGIYANTDVTRGVHKAPANEPVLGALRFAQDVNRFQQELLNPNGINCLRSFPGRGHRVWGGRTLSSDPEWKYVNVRRYFLYLERSIDKSTQWVVFEPNGERLWANVRTTVEDFLYNEWFNGHLLGSSPKEAYFVRCDRSTMTQNDLDNGRLVCEVGVAPLRPAEFVIFRIGQKTANA
jgi:hypothetical protein